MPIASADEGVCYERVNSAIVVQCAAVGVEIIIIAGNAETVYCREPGSTHVIVVSGDDNTVTCQEMMA